MPKFHCSKCHEEKDSTSFYRDSMAKRGFRSECKDCTKIYRVPYRKRTPDLARYYRKLNLKNNPDKYRMLAAAARARRNGAESSPYSTDQILELYGALCHICELPIDLEAARSAGSAGWENGLHLDHVIPLSRGGSNNIQNVRPVHGLCNLKKGASLQW